MGTGAFMGKTVAGVFAFRLGIIVLMLVLVTACTTIYRNHGYVPSDTEMASVAIGDSRDKVSEKIGRPSALGLLNDVGWFYVQSRFSYRGAFEPKEVERQVVAITFTEAGTVANIERFGLERGKVVPLSRRVTKSNIKTIGFIHQLLGNFGRIGTVALDPQ